MDNYSDINQLIRKIKFNLEEQQVIKDLKIEPDVFLPLLFSLKFGGNWSIKNKTDSLKVMAIKDKLTRYDPEKMTGSTLEIIHLISNPSIINEEGQIYRLEKCSESKERRVVTRPYKVQIDGLDIIRAELNPKTMDIAIKHVNGPLSFEGSAAFGISHEMEHLRGSKKDTGKCLWDFRYQTVD
ncbi:MAG: hypothetical protein LLF83_09340 [Methanobacterium sp.]|nr:hypothetical protein [Methanobacterium sp.]